MSHKSIENLLPTYLSRTDKESVKDVLNKFKKNHSFQELYDKFYLSQKTAHFLQGDVMAYVRFPFWNKESSRFEKKYIPAMIVSNTCDMERENVRSVPKEVMFAPCIKINEYSKLIPEKSKKNTIENIKQQLYSNLFYLPPISLSNDEEYIVELDSIFTFPEAEFHKISDELIHTRIATLSDISYYLLIVKLSYHLCRLPKEKHR